MDKRKQALSSKPITNSEITTVLVASRVNLTPITSKKAFASRFSPTDRTKQLVSKSKVKLSPISVRNVTEITTMIEENETPDISIKGDNCVIQTKVKLTPSLSKNSTSKAVSNVTKKTPVTDIIVSETQHAINSSRSTAKPTSNDKYPIHNFRLIWLHSNVIKFNTNYEPTISKFRQVIDAIDTFTSSEKCIEFVKTKPDEILLMIVSNDLAQSTIPLIHDLFQIHSIFIFSESKSKHNKLWIKNWEKIEGIFTSIGSISEILPQEIQQYHHDSPTIIVTNVDPIQLDRSFICTQLLKEIIAEMKFNIKAKKEFIQFYRQKHRVDNSVIDEMESNYDIHTPIWWYTRDSCLSDMINQAFRLQDINVIIKMGFFIQDLHKQIEHFYRPPSEKLVFYRGQGLSSADFEQLRTMPGGLFFFNSFLSTSIDQNVALLHADSSRHDSDSIGIVFQINIDPVAHISMPFVSLDNDNYHSDSKGEFLFTAYTVFRVGEMKQLEDRLWQVELSLTNDDDDDVKKLTEYIRQGTEGSTEWDRLGKLLLKMGHFDKAEEVFQILIENSAKTDIKGLAHRFHQMGLLKTKTGFYKKAIIYYNKAIKMYKTCADSKYSDISTIHNDIGSLYQQTEEYANALKYYQMALDIEKESNPINYSNLAIIYDNIAEVDKNMKQYSTALQFYQIILKIHKKCIPLNFQKLSTAYRNIAEMHCFMEEYSETLKCYQKMFNIQQYYLPQNAIDTAAIENNIGQMYEKMGEHWKASKHYENALKCCQMALEASLASDPQNVQDLAITYNTIAPIYKNMKDYSKAYQFYRMIIEILLKYPHVKKPDLAATYDNIGQIYQNIHQNKNAYLFYREARRIAEQSSPPNPSQLRLYSAHCSGISTIDFTMAFGLVEWKFTENMSLIPI